MIRKASILAVAVLMVTAGCVGTFFGDDGGETQSPPPIEDVPADAAFVASYDADLVKDPATESIVDTYLQERYPDGTDRPQTLEGILERVENETVAETNLSVSEVGGAMAFGRLPQVATMPSTGQTSPYAGVLVRTTWKRDAVVEAFRKQYEMTESTYNGVKVYRQTDSPGNETALAFAKYDQDLYVFGSIAAVRDVVDVAEGNGERIDEGLKSAYESTNSEGYVRFAVAVPPEYRQAASGGGTGPVSVRTSDIQNVTHLSGVYYTEGGQDGVVGLNVSAHFSSAASAERIGQQAKGILALGKGMVQNETAKAQLDKLSIAQSGTVVTLSYESNVSAIEDLVEQYAGVSRDLPTATVYGRFVDVQRPRVARAE